MAVDTKHQPGNNPPSNDDGSRSTSPTAHSIDAADGFETADENSNNNSTEGQKDNQFFKDFSWVSTNNFGKSDVTPSSTTTS